MGSMPLVARAILGRKLLLILLRNFLSFDGGGLLPVGCPRKVPLSAAGKNCQAKEAVLISLLKNEPHK